MRRAALGLRGIGLALIGIEIAALGLRAGLGTFVALMTIASLFYGAAVVIVLRARLPRGSVFGILAVALAMRGLALASPPFLSTDLHRYVWDGMVQEAGINPYRYRPAAPQLAFLRNRTIYPAINRKTTARTIYPPFAEAVFALVACASPTLTAMKAAMTGFDLIAIAALLALLRRAGSGYERVLIYAWNPLPVIEFAGNGHVDAILAACVALALLASVAGRQGWSAAAFTCAVLAKFLPALLLPALWRPPRMRFIIVAIALMAGFYAAYAGVGWHELGFLPGYVRAEGIASGRGILWLQALGHVMRLPPVAGPLYLAAASLSLCGLGLAVWRHPLPADEAERTLAVAADAGLLATALMLAITPHYPWYLTWLLVPLAIAPSAPGLYMTAAAFLIYRVPAEIGIPGPALVYVPAAALMLVRAARRRRAETKRG